MLPWQLLVKFVTSLSSSWYYSHVIMVSWYHGIMPILPRVLGWFFDLFLSNVRPSWTLRWRPGHRQTAELTHWFVALKLCSASGSVWVLFGSCGSLVWGTWNGHWSAASALPPSLEPTVRCWGQTSSGNQSASLRLALWLAPPGRSTREFTCKLSQESPECQQTLPTSPLFLFCLIADFTAWTSGDKITIMTSGNNRRWPTCSAPVTLSSLTPGHQIPEAASSARVSIPQCVCVCVCNRCWKRLYKEN